MYNQSDCVINLPLSGGEVVQGVFLTAQGAIANGTTDSVGVSKYNSENGMAVAIFKGIGKVRVGVAIDEDVTKLTADAEGKAIPWTAGKEVYGLRYADHIQATPGDFLPVVIMQAAGQ